MSDDLAEVEKIAGALLAKLSPASRRSLLRRMARDLAASQRARIKNQQEPDGTAFAPRQKKLPLQQGNHAVSFLYPAGGSGTPRRVILKSYTIANNMMTGFDIEAEGIRSFFYDKVTKWLPVPPGYRNAGGGLPRKGALRRKMMFRKLASPRFLRSGNDDTELWVGFSGRAAEIARIHQEGLKDKPSARADAITYPRRTLLGFTAADRTM
ncbi:MAG: phage virion morphogenesis protein, partial [Rhizomicrobium sp.]